MPYRRVISTVLFILGLLWLTGCAGHEGLLGGMHISVTTPSSPVVEKTAVSVETLPSEPAVPTLDYQVGVGDLISVTVYGRPELSSAGRPSRVDGSGNIQLPLIGTVKVDGLATSLIRGRVETLLLKFMQSPSVVVEVTQYRSRPLYLVGNFKAPGVFYMERPMTLLQGIALGSGFEPFANIRGVRLLRDRQIAPVDIYALIQDGKIDQNIWLKGGDTIFIPDNRNQNVFVFGAVEKPGMIPMPQGRMNIVEAVASASPKTNAKDMKNIRIIRSLTTTSGELLVVDVERILRGEALSFQLLDGDVVYVPNNAFATWNDVAKEIVPYLQVIGGLLQPFVTIKYLSNN